MYSVPVSEFIRVLRACRLRSAGCGLDRDRCTGRFQESMERLEQRLRSWGYDLDELDQDNPYTAYLRAS